VAVLEHLLGTLPGGTGQPGPLSSFGAWDRMKMWVKGELPNNRTPQPIPKKPDLALMIEKFEAVFG
jgi:hypothetical protein